MKIPFTQLTMVSIPGDQQQPPADTSETEDGC